MMKMIAIVFIYLFVSIAGAAAEPGAQLRDVVPHIVTTGEASMEVVPDQADIRLGVTSENATSEAAVEATAKATADVIGAVKAWGIDSRDIKSTFSAAAQYDNVTDPVTHVSQKNFKSYVATSTVVVRVHDISKAGALARELIAKGANTFHRIDYSYSKAKAVRRQLAADAIRDALDSAKVYTDAVNVTLGRVLQIGGEMQPNEGLADLPARGSSPVRSRTVIPTKPGVLELNERISVMWEIEGKPH